MQCVNMSFHDATKTNEDWNITIDTYMYNLDIKSFYHDIRNVIRVIDLISTLMSHVHSTLLHAAVQQR